MANPEQLAYLQDGADEWNNYRREFAITRPELLGANLTNAILLQTDLTEANLAGVDLSKTDLIGAVGLNKHERA
jgi:uncharacterized protein YjbI with pentapeptide repeats